MENGKCCQSESLIQVIWAGKNFRFEPRKGSEKQQTASIRGVVFRAVKRFERFWIFAVCSQRSASRQFTDRSLEKVCGLQHLTGFPTWLSLRDQPGYLGWQSQDF
jgi:hypothetical protein